MSLNDTQGKDVTRRLQHKRGRRSREEMRQLQLEREELETVSFPVCTAHPDCHACRNGRCMALDRNDFGRRDCPFYKNSEINRREQREGLEKLIRMGRTDLIDKYKRTFQELGIFGMSDSFTEQATAELDRYSESYLRELLSMDTSNGPEEVSGLPTDEEDDWDD